MRILIVLSIFLSGCSLFNRNTEISRDQNFISFLENIKDVKVSEVPTLIEYLETLPNIESLDQEIVTKILNYESKKNRESLNILSQKCKSGDQDFCTKLFYTYISLEDRSKANETSLQICKINENHKLCVKSQSKINNQDIKFISKKNIDHQHDCVSNDIKSCLHLAQHHYENNDLDKAEQYYEKVCNLSKETNCFMLSAINYFKDTPEGYKKAITYSKSSCLSGDKKSCSIYATSLLNTGKSDYQKIFEKGCSLGDGEQCFITANHKKYLGSIHKINLITYSCNNYNEHACIQLGLILNKRDPSSVDLRQRQGFYLIERGCIFSPLNEVCNSDAYKQ